MIKRFFSEILLDLGDLEADYRAFYLKNDIEQTILSLSIAVISVLAMLRVDAVLFGDQPGILLGLAAYRGAFILITLLVMLAIRKTAKVRLYDRLALAWILLMILFFVLSSFTRPANYLTTPFEIIIPFSIYVLSPLKIKQNFALALGFTVAALSVNYFFKTGIEPLVLNATTAAQIIVHALGLGSALQIQSYRRRSFKAYIQEKDAKEMVAYLANIDPLTKSLTRRQFFNIAESEFLRYSRYRRPLSVLILDADSFKGINDTYGHHAGDVVLRSLSLVAMEQKRAQDTFGRLGGEEFGLLLPETTLEQARIVAERIRKAWEQTPTNMDGEPIHSTVSIGGAEAAPGDTYFEDILRRADRMLYKAKERGKNQVAME
ncbi:MAG TPA: GGDEF domain-containing protein [Anaerolineales bacterium]|nr:GGDEF domain-containing protein [Anaerolineales bacterium]